MSIAAKAELTTADIIVENFITDHQGKKVYVEYALNEDAEFETVEFPFDKVIKWFEHNNPLYVSYFRSKCYDEEGGYRLPISDFELLEDLERKPETQKRFILDYLLS